jgi:hypothetical protein
MPKKLDDVFQATMDRIRRQPLSKSTQGLDVLEWIFLAFKQLTTAELRHALAVNEYDTSADSLDLNNLPFEKSLTDCCHGLVVVNQETSSIPLVHKSLQDFLKKQHETDQLFINGHHEIARACLIYVGLNYETTDDRLQWDEFLLRNLH